MTTRFLSRTMLFCLALASSLPIAANADDAPATDKPKDIAGVWQGALKIGAIELRLVIHLEKTEKGEWKASLDSPDQNAKGIAIEDVKLDDGNLVLTSKAVQGTFEGKLSEDGKELVGKWKQGGQALALTLKRLEKEPDYSKPQDPKKPYPYAEEEVTYENQEADVKLAGTLTLPKSKGKVPAVLLITGSGPQDRDESLLGHRPFLVLADYLTRRGIAVLRVDDRGVGGSTGNVSKATTQDFAGDALAGVKYLRSRKEINPKKIGLIGHSEGGLIAPLAAVKSKDVAFIVLMAGTGVTGEEILYRQGELIARAEGADDDKVALTRKGQEESFALMKEKLDDAEIEKKLMEIVAKEVSESGVTDEAAKAALKAQGEAQIKALLSPWFRSFLAYDPRPTLAKVKCPVLAVNGEKDLQVDPKQNLPEIEKALKAGGNKDHTLKEFPGLNHLFQTCQTGSPSEYGKIDETISPAALELMGDWIAQHAK